MRVKKTHRFTLRAGEMIRIRVQASAPIENCQLIFVRHTRDKFALIVSGDAVIEEEQEEQKTKGQ